MEMKILISEEDFKFGEVEGVVDGGFDVGDGVNMGMVEEGMRGVCGLGFEEWVRGVGGG